MPRPSRSAGQNPPMTSSHPSNASAAAHSTHTQNVHRNFGIGTLGINFYWNTGRTYSDAQPPVAGPGGSRAVCSDGAETANVANARYIRRGTDGGGRASQDRVLPRAQARERDACRRAG